VFDPPADFIPPRNSARRQRQWWQQMYDWLAQELDRQHTEAMRYANANTQWLWKKIKKHETLPPEEKAIKAARCGDPELLRKLYPQFADCIHAPPRPRGRREDPSKAFKPAKLAAGFVPRIRALWQQQYKKKNRPERDRLTTSGAPPNRAASTSSPAANPASNSLLISR
jgi:hypothetical protein